MSAPVQYQPTQQQPAAGIATASVVLGAVGFFVGICSVIGLVLGLVARGKAKRGEISPARVTAGIVVSAISLGLGVIAWIVIIAAIGAGSTATTTSAIDGAAITAGAPAVETQTETPVQDEAPAVEAPAAVEATQVAPAPSQSSTTQTASPVEAPAAAAGPTVSQKNAVRTAESYLEYTAFSRSGLIGQLEYEGFSTEDATYGVDNTTVDYDEQAAKSAAQYLEYSSFSRQGLIDQLEYEGYTAAQAEYGVAQTGL